LKYGAIDIGSNAVRLLIGEVREKNDKISIRKLSLIRVPIRLGESVFDDGIISKIKADKLIKSMKSFILLNDIYETKGLMAFATSAMREAKNREEIIERVQKETKLEIEIISGQKEADMLFTTFFLKSFKKDKSYLYIDVGGGSTEITLLRNGEKIKSKSFRLGTVRSIYGKIAEKTWTELEEYITELCQGEKNITAIGTGGNINRLFKMSKLQYGEPLSLEKIIELSDLINSLTFEERIEKLYLRPDRADVIVPATKIYRTIMEVAKIKRMIVPKIGLTDGMILTQYKRDKKKD
jgi:exopolyphosphatase / guanosine-5'-triphosphate,3'-diphosphate pyrophosphatase